MKESYFWWIMTFSLAVIAVLVILYRDLLSSDPMFVEVLGTLLGVLIAIFLSESIRNNVEERRAKSVQDDLVGEVRDILENAERLFIRELYSTMWSSVKARGIPDRIEPKLRRALADAFELFEICNYSVRQLEEYKLTPNPDDKKLDSLEFILNDAKERMVKVAREVLEMVGS